MLAEQLKFSRGQNANDVYFAKLTDYARTRDNYTPLFSYVDGSKHPGRIRGKQWDDTMFEMSVDLHDDDIAYLKSPSTSQPEIQEHLSFMIGNGRRKVEVDIRQCIAEVKNV